MEPTGPRVGRVALVTGVSRRIGIGMELARRMLADGASVFATGWVPHDQEMPWGADEGGQAAILESLGGAGQRQQLSPADRARLRALGYISPAPDEESPADP